MPDDMIEIRAMLERLRDRYPRADSHGAPANETRELLETLVRHTLALERRVAALEGASARLLPADKSDDCRSPRAVFDDKELHGGW